MDICIYIYIYAYICIYACMLMHSHTHTHTHTYTYTYLFATVPPTPTHETYSPPFPLTPPTPNTLPPQPPPMKLICQHSPLTHAHIHPQPPPIKHICRCLPPPQPPIPPPHPWNLNCKNRKLSTFRAAKMWAGSDRPDAAQECWERSAYGDSPWPGGQHWGAVVTPVSSSAPDCHLETPAQLLPSCDGCRAGRAQAEIPAPGVSAEI